MHRGHSESALLPKTLAYTFFKSTSVQSGPFLSWGDQQTQKLPCIESKISLSFLLLSLFFLLFLLCHQSPYSPLGLSSIFLTKFDSDIILFHDYTNCSYVRCMKIFIEYQNCSHVRCMKIFTRFDIVWKICSLENGAVRDFTLAQVMATIHPLMFAVDIFTAPTQIEYNISLKLLSIFLWLSFG